MPNQERSSQSFPSGVKRLRMLTMLPYWWFSDRSFCQAGIRHIGHSITAIPFPSSFAITHFLRRRSAHQAPRSPASCNIELRQPAASIAELLLSFVTVEKGSQGLPAEGVPASGELVRLLIEARAARATQRSVAVIHGRWVSLISLYGSVSSVAGRVQILTRACK